MSCAHLLTPQKEKPCLRLRRKHARASEIAVAMETRYTPKAESSLKG